MVKLFRLENLELKSQGLRPRLLLGLSDFRLVGLLGGVVDPRHEAQKGAVRLY